MEISRGRLLIHEASRVPLGSRPQPDRAELEFGQRPPPRFAFLEELVAVVGLAKASIALVMIGRRGDKPLGLQDGIDAGLGGGGFSRNWRCFGTSSRQAVKSRPLDGVAPAPIAATTALEMIRPVPGTLIGVRLPVSDHLFLSCLRPLHVYQRAALDGKFVPHVGGFAAHVRDVQSRCSAVAYNHEWCPDGGMRGRD